MGYAYKYYAQFIMLMVIIYTLGVFIPEVVYVLFPVVLFLLGYKKFFFELLVLSILFLILSDYVPISSATRDSLQFAKDLKFLAPITLFAFFLFYREDFDLNLSFFVPFIPFFFNCMYRPFLFTKYFNRHSKNHFIYNYVLYRTPLRAVLA
jgi:hypothetical protein